MLDRQVPRSVYTQPTTVKPQPFLHSASRPQHPRQVQYLQHPLGQHTTRTIASAATTASPAPTTTGSVPPAVLPGTPANFPIKEAELIKLAQDLFIGADAGVTNDELLADNFRFEFPVISLSKKEYLKAVRSFQIRQAFPDVAPHPYHWRVDPFEPNRVWFTVRSTGTHTGDLKFNTTFKATGKVYQGAPECMSFTFNEQGKATSYTGGYVMDRRVGNTKGLGALFGILAAIGGPVLAPDSFTWLFFKQVNKSRLAVAWLFNAATFGALKKKD